MHENEIDGYDENDDVTSAESVGCGDDNCEVGNDDEIIGYFCYC